nr:MAG TPA: hypothetical protein [Caudoviricetes sp.]DAY46809.1 MAG TPA: hypothetical protein [Caudoviricetes sp.]
MTKLQKFTCCFLVDGVLIFKTYIKRASFNRR